MSYQRLYYLDVGQGMCTYFEEYDDGDVVSNALFDLGSTKSRTRAGTPTIQFLVQQIKARDWTGDEGQLDVVFLSHKDADHVNLLWRLLEALPNMLISKVFHSGRYEWYTSSKGNILTALGKRTPDAKACVRNFSIGYNSFESTPFPPIWTSDYHARAYVIAVNTSEAEGNRGKPVVDVYDKALPDGDLANSTSLGIYLKMFNVGAVLFGDATFSTFQFVNELFLRQKVWLQDTFVLQAPHHGSRRTAFGLSATNGFISQESLKVVDTFASLTYGATIIASADTQHSHPSLETINTFLKYADHARTWWTDTSISPYHYASVYFDVPLSTTQGAPERYYTYQTKQNFYTTLYYGLNTTKWNYSFPPQALPTTPPLGTAFTEGMNWAYQVDANSSVNQRNIPLLGIPSNRLPKTKKSLHALFATATQALAERNVVPAPSVQPASPGAPRAPARPQRTLRRLTLRP